MLQWPVTLFSDDGNQYGMLENYSPTKWRLRRVICGQKTFMTVATYQPGGGGGDYGPAYDLVVVLTLVTFTTDCCCWTLLLWPHWQLIYSICWFVLHYDDLIFIVGICVIVIYSIWYLHLFVDCSLDWHLMTLLVCGDYICWYPIYSDCYIVVPRWPPIRYSVLPDVGVLLLVWHLLVTVFGGIPIPRWRLSTRRPILITSIGGLSWRFGGDDGVPALDDQAVTAWRCSQCDDPSSMLIRYRLLLTPDKPPIEMTTMTTPWYDGWPWCCIDGPGPRHCGPADIDGRHSIQAVLMTLAKFGNVAPPVGGIDTVWHCYWW